MMGIRRVVLAGTATIGLAAAAAVPALEGSPPASAARVHAAQAGLPPRPSAEVRLILRRINARRIENYDRKLVSFGTRHTLSSQTDPNRGIGAARDWIYGMFQQFARASGGRMTVQKQSFVHPPGERNPQPVTVTNVVATLRGTQPASADRVYVVSGHYDSRCSDVLNATCDAPGADDDASGVSAVLELARVMASRKLDATVIFMAVARAEQGPPRTAPLAVHGQKARAGT